VLVQAYTLVEETKPVQVETVKKPAPLLENESVETVISGPNEIKNQP
jgi:hypothetical protein